MFMINFQLQRDINENCIKNNALINIYENFA